LKDIDLKETLSKLDEAFKIAETIVDEAFTKNLKVNSKEYLEETISIILLIARRLFVFLLGLHNSEENFETKRKRKFGH
jgi:hypothetical protein